MNGVNVVSVANVLLNDEKMYHVGDVLNNFANYYGVTVEEIPNLFAIDKVITKEQIINYLLKNQNLLWENRYGIKANINNIIKERMLDYDMFYQKLAILSHKGLNYLSLLQYVANIPDVFHEDEFYERIFEQLHISHYGKGMIGNQLRQLLVPLMHIVKEIQKNLKVVNDLETYNHQSFDSFARNYGETEFHAIDFVTYREESLIADKTTFDATKRRYLSSKII